MANKKVSTDIQAFKSVTRILKTGVFNYLLFILAICYLFFWTYTASEYLSMSCRCKIAVGSTFLKEVFPPTMDITYFMNWLRAFLISISVEFLTLYFLAVKSKLAFHSAILFGKLLPAALLHNLPGFLLLLTFMARAENITWYMLVTILSIPLLFIPRFSIYQGARLYPVSVNYHLIPSKLPKAVTGLVCLLFFGYLTLSTLFSFHTDIWPFFFGGMVLSACYLYVEVIKK